VRGDNFVRMIFGIPLAVAAVYFLAHVTDSTSS
jgi:hypothetical protein